jgi:hypothetical protein
MLIRAGARCNASFDSNEFDAFHNLSKILQKISRRSGEKDESEIPLINGFNDIPLGSYRLGVDLCD